VQAIARSRVRARRIRASAATALAAALATLALSACGGTSTEDATRATAASRGGVDPKVTALLPADLRNGGTLVAASDATYAPDEFIGEDGKTVVGMSADLADALSRLLGVEIQLRNAPYDSIIPAIAAGRYDLVLSSMTDTKERQGTLDFVDYFVAGTTFYTRSDGPDVSGLADLCGHMVAAQKATTQQTDVQKQADACRAHDEPTLTPLVFPDQNAVNLALSSGRADVAIADSPVAYYQVKQSAGKFRIVGQTYGKAPYGIGVRHGSELVAPLRAAVQQLIDDGTYGKILARWGNDAGAVKTAVVNGGKG